MHSFVLMACLALVELYLPDAHYKKEIAAIILLETNCGILERDSKAGAKGLAQIMPDTAKWLWPKCKMHGEYNEKLLEDRRINLTLAYCYVNILLNDYKSWSMVAAHYNGGNRQAKRLAELRPMAFETANYVARFKYILDLYKLELRRTK